MRILFVVALLALSTGVFGLTPHPRLLAVQADFDRLREGVKSNPVLARWYAKLRAEGDTDLKKPPFRYELRDGVRLLMVSRDVLRLVTVESLLYQVGRDARDRDRAWAELDNVAKFPDWHPAHFLDVAEMAAAVALGYDWLASDLTADQRTELRTALVEKALKPAAPFLEKKTGWASVTNNWNFVCNGGITLAALAVADEEPHWVEELLPLTLASLPRALAGYAPDGAWNESPGYWDYGTSYLVELIAALQTAEGSDSGLLQTPGLDRTGDFALAMTGPNRSVFGFGDVGGTMGRVSAPALWYLAKVYNKPAYAAARVLEADRRPDPLDLLWYDGDSVARGQHAATLPLDQRFRRVEAVTLRSSWTDPEGIFVGFKGTAFPDRNHTDLDNGTVFFGALGQVWATELGADDYNLPGYFDMNGKHPANRWNYYRKRAEGQNTLVINPGLGPDQRPEAPAPLVGFGSGAEGWAVADLTQAWPGTVDVRRGIRLFDGRTKVLIQDEVHLVRPGDVWWFLHLEKGVNVTLDPDGRSVILSRPDQTGKVWVHLIGGPPELRFELRDAVPLPTSPQVEQNPNTGIKKLVLHAQALKDGVWAVELVPTRMEAANLAPDPVLTPLLVWF